jgi:UPF0755 protein
MRRLFTVLIALTSLGFICLMAGGWWVIQEIHRPAPFDTPRELMVTNGQTGLSLATKLREQDTITNDKLFYALLRVQPITLKTGEYEIPAHSSIKEIRDILKSGKTIQRQFTVAEGLTVKQVMILLQQNEFLTGEISTPPEEGSLLPDTYAFTRGETRQVLIDRMQAAQKTLLDELWDKRDPRLPLQTPLEAITLASIVEKETGQADERRKIAGLFYNRLRAGMLLQTDPTVVYAVTDGLGHMGGKPLLKKHLGIDSPYNTYKYAGLPPTPIANPGRASIEAVFNPEKHDDLFFVADGTGGHVFSETLSGHNANVTQWRKIKKGK